MAPTASRGGSSTSATPPSPRSRRSPKASRTSRSPGSTRAAITPTQIRALAARHGIRPRKSLGQHFLIDPSLARRIVELSGVGPGDHVLEIGAGLGSLTVPLAATGAEIVAVEVDRFLIPALREVASGAPTVRVMHADAVSAEWEGILGGEGPWVVVANLPYNVAVPVVMRLLETVPEIERMLITVQREVGQRLAAHPGEPAFGAVSLRVAYRADARVVRAVSRAVFWPRPNVDSVLVSLVRRPPGVRVDEGALWHVVDTAFNQRRKTMRGAMVRLGLTREEAEAALAACGVEVLTRPERLGLEPFGCLAEQWLQATASVPTDGSPR